MDPTDIGLFRLAEQRLAWVDQRQRLLAQNVANANTPEFQPRDVSPFKTLVTSPSLRQTSPMHIAAPGQAAGGTIQVASERTPSGNGISIEDQLSRVADTSGIQELVLNLERSYMGMFRTVLGRAS